MPVAVDAQHDRQLVAAQRVVVRELEVGVVHRPPVVGALVVLEDLLAVEVVHQAKILLDLRQPGDRGASTSSRVLCTAKDARDVAPTPRRRMSGCAQWCPARTQTPWRPRISATSCGWMPSSAKETSAPRCVGVGRAVEREPGNARRGARARRRRARARARARAPCRCPRRKSTAAPSPMRLGDRRRAGLELRRRSAPSAISSSETEAIMWPPPRNGGIASSSSRAPVQDADAGRPVGLVAGPGVEVGADRAEVDRDLRHGLRAVDDDDARPASCARRDDLLDRVDRAEHVGDVRDGDDLDVAAARAGASSSSRSSRPSSSTPTTRARRRARSAEHAATARSWSGAPSR